MKRKNIKIGEQESDDDQKVDDNKLPPAYRTQNSTSNESVKDTRFILRFCHRDEINDRLQPTILMKSTFLSKLDFMKEIGIKNSYMYEID